MRRMGIEELLVWAFTRELPKARRDAMDFAPCGFSAGGGSWSDGLSVVDNSHGVVVDFLSDSEPHPDAEYVSLIVRDLDDYPVELPDDWNPLSDLRLTDDEARGAVARGLDTIMRREAGALVLRRPLSDLVRTRAILGDSPDWEAEKPVRKPVCGPKGHPKWFRMVDAPYTDAFGKKVERKVEVDGYNQVAQRPYPGAYRKTLLDPDPAHAVAWRAEYELWVIALGVLFEELDGRLVDHDVVPSARPIRPWESGDITGPSVLPDLTAASVEPWVQSKPLRYSALTLLEPEKVTVLKKTGKRRRKRPA